MLTPQSSFALPRSKAIHWGSLMALAQRVPSSPSFTLGANASPLDALTTAPRARSSVSHMLTDTGDDDGIDELA
ncbi:MAG: hypothetical protein SGPRY_006223 [Prymnesium sp.]